MTNSDTLKKNMLEALEKTLSIVSTACKMVGISRNTHYRWLKEDPQYEASVTELHNVVLDFAESHLHLQIKEGSVPATLFLLKTIGKKRGYVERQEITGADGEQMSFEVNIITNGEKED